MVGTSDSMTMLIRLAAIVLLALRPVNGAKIDIINTCLKVKTTCATSRCNVPVKCYVLNGGGGKTTIDVGANWEAGVIWGFDGNSGSPSLGNTAKPQANLAEITIDDTQGQDSYDISNVVSITMPIILNLTEATGLNVQERGCNKNIDVLKGKYMC